MNKIGNCYAITETLTNEKYHLVLGLKMGITANPFTKLSITEM